MTEVFISQSRPDVAEARVVKFGRPVVGATLQQFANAANSLAAGRGFAHVQKTFGYKMSGTATQQTVGIENLLLDPGLDDFTYDLTIPQVHPLATTVGLVIMAQFHDAGSAQPEILIEMTRIADNALVDRLDGNPAMNLTVSNQSLPGGGKSQSEYPDGLSGSGTGNLYPLRTIFCVNDEGTDTSGPRALHYSSGISEGDGVRITITTTRVRIWSVLAFEQPRLSMTKA